MVAVIEVSNTDELNELINLLYGDREILINNDYNKYNFVDLTKDNVYII
tara:strand:+ start:640 stop:786 length:147 start_codon:yes stop_codon:yes gene_type:complete